MLASQNITASDGFATNYMTFNAEEADVYYLGVELSEGDNAEIYIDNAELDPPIVPDNPYEGESTIDVINQLPFEYCAVTEVVSNHEVTNRVIISLEDELD